MSTPGPEQHPPGDSGYPPMPPASGPTGPGGYGPGQPMAQAPRNGFGITALILGILAIVLCWSALGGIVLGVLALVFGILGVRRANRRIASNKGMSIAGIVTGAIGLILGIIFAISFGALFSMFGNQISDYQDCLQQAGGDQSQVQQCQQQFSDQVNGKINN